MKAADSAAEIRGGGEKEEPIAQIAYDLFGQIAYDLSGSGPPPAK